MIELGQAGDVIHISGTGTANSPMQLCSSTPIEHDLVIEGIVGIPTIQCTEAETLSIVVSVQGGTVRIRNPRIATGVIQTNNAILIVQDCIFDNDARIYGMTIPSMIKHKNEPTPSALVFLLETIRHAFPE